MATVRQRPRHGNRWFGVVYPENAPAHWHSIYFPVGDLGGKCELNKNFQDSFIEGLACNFAISDKQNKVTPEKLEVVALRYQTTQLAYRLLPTLELPALIVEPTLYKAKAYAPYVAVLGSGVLATPLAIYLSQILNAA